MLLSLLFFTVDIDEAIDLGGHQKAKQANSPRLKPSVNDNLFLKFTSS